MSFFNDKVSGKTVNKAGGFALSHNPETELVFAVLTTFLGNKFYESGDERIERITSLCSQVSDEFISRLAVYARREFHLRSVSHLLVSILAKKHRGDSLVRNTIVAISERPDDLTEIVAACGFPMAKQVKRGVRRSLYKFSPYQLAKYKMTQKKVSLVDLFNLTHPKPEFASEEQKVAWASLIKGNLVSSGTWESELSAGKDKAKVWNDLVMENKLGYMALLRNLRNIDEQASESVKDKACEMISDKERVLKSKQLPFRFYSAYEQITNQNMLEAVSRALDHSVSNVPSFQGKSLIAIDCSGSMMSGAIKVASIFAAALIKSNNADVILYDTDIKELKYIKSDSTLTIANTIQSQADGGGTNTSLVFQYAHQKAIKYGRIIILSDNESWTDSYYNSGTQDTYKEYRKENDCYVYALDIEGYGTKDIDSEKVLHVAGWSEKILDFIKNAESKDDLVKAIKNYEI